MSADEPMETEGTVTNSRRRASWIALVSLLLGLVAVVGVCLWGSSSSCENLVRKRLIARLEASTGGRVEIHSLHWRLMSLEVRADGVVIHGRERADEAPYAQIGELRVQMSVLGILSPRILLRELNVVRPAIHLIVYQDGSTNQPTPTHKTPGGGRC
jgi:translocation and assembly module TamB